MTEVRSRSGWTVPVLIAVAVAVAIVAGLIAFIHFLGPDSLPFDYSGFDGKK